jgi:hypothetical protein
VDERGDNLPWPEMVEPLTRVCVQCGAEYSRRRANGRLREPRRWRRSLYCSRGCAAQHRGRWKALPLAGLEPVSPPPKPKLRVRQPGRPSRKTGLRAILTAERIARIMQARVSGMTFREIGLEEGVSMQRVHRLFWRALGANPHDPARLRRQAARERAMLIAGP